jgi:UV DNA damage repair endonuclease
MRKVTLNFAAENGICMFRVEGTLLGACDNVRKTIDNYLPTILEAMQAIGMIASAFDIGPDVDYSMNMLD